MEWATVILCLIILGVAAFTLVWLFDDARDSIQKKTEQRKEELDKLDKE